MLPFNNGFGMIHGNALFPQQILLPGMQPRGGLAAAAAFQQNQAVAVAQAQAQAHAVHHAQAAHQAHQVQQAQVRNAVAAAAAAASRPQPMLVPPGMGDQAGASSTASPGTGPQWQELTASDGRTYYYNRMTKQSTWTKPDDLKTPAERSTPTSVWKVYKHTDGRPYYYNTETKETTWTAPEGLNPTVGTPSNIPSFEPKEPKPEPKEPKNEKSEMDKAMEATLASMGMSTDVKSDKPLSDVPMVDEEQELKKRQADLFRELLRDKYNDGKITATDGWDVAVKHIQSDNRFRVLNKVSEKKQLFNAWKVQRQKEERDEKRVAIKKAKEDLEKWLQDHPKMKNQHFRYQKAIEVFEKEPIWKSVAEDDRREIFKDVMEFVTKREADMTKKTRERNTQALSDILNGMDDITYRTTWAQAQRLLIENPAFSTDETLQSMDKEDALIVFENHIRGAEKEHEKEKEAEDLRLKRQERRVREAFQGFLEELHKKGSLNSVSLWSSLYPMIASDPRFDTMLTQSGSTPLDLFKFYVDELKNQYVEHRRIIKDILTDLSKTVKVTTTCDELVSWIQSDERGKQVDHGNMKLYFNSLMEKAESRERELKREEQRKQKRQEGEFRNLLRAIVPPIEETTEWSTVRGKIEHEEAFKVIETEELREQYFKDFIVQVGDACGHHHSSKKKKKEKRKKGKKSDESDSEDDRGKKKRRHKDESSDEEKDRKRRRKSRRSRSRSRSESRSGDERRKRRDSDSE